MLQVDIRWYVAEELQKLEKSGDILELKVLKKL